MTTLQPTTVSDISIWGIAAHGAVLSLPKIIGINGGTWVIDVENNPDGSCAGIGLTNNGREIHFLSVDLCKKLQEQENNFFESLRLVGHNIKYDVQMLRKWGFNVSPDQIIWDTQLAEYIKDSTRIKYGLKAVVAEYFGARYPTYKELCGTGKKAIPIGSLPLDIVANYCSCDVLFTWKLYQQQITRLTEAQKDYLNIIELPTMRVLLEMEERGVQIDANYIRDLDARFETEISGVVTAFRRQTESECNLNSPVQVRRLLVDKTGRQWKSTASEELKKFGHVPLVKDLLRYRELNKLKSTYTSVLLEESKDAPTYRLHARFNQTNTATGRLSSSEPNLQNIPTRTDEGNLIRKGFTAKPDYVLIDADYSQIEPRLMAHFSQDRALLAVFQEKKDLYDFVATVVGCERSIAKVLWLAMAYNAGAYKIAITAGIGMQTAENFLNKMRNRFSQFFYWREKTIAQVEVNRGVRTLFGRFIPLTAQYAHLAPNYMIQGSAAEIMKLAIHETRDYSPICTVHDELIFERANSFCTEEIKNIMENVIELSVPLVVEVGTGANWAEAKN